MNVAPPRTCPGVPELETLEAGRSLYRIHSARYGPVAFNPTLAKVYGGGRFDGTADDPHGVLYAGEDDACAVAETLLRDVPLHDARERWLPAATLAGKCVSRLDVTLELVLVKLYGAGLLQVGQTAWLTSSEPRDYVFTRAWASAIRSWVPAAHGFAWRSARLNDRLALVLFDDRCPPAALRPAPHPVLGASNPGGHPLDTDPGRAFAEEMLRSFGCPVR